MSALLQYLLNSLKVVPLKFVLGIHKILRLQELSAEQRQFGATNSDEFFSKTKNFF